MELTQQHLALLCNISGRFCADSLAVGDETLASELVKSGHVARMSVNPDLWAITSKGLDALENNR